MAFCMTHCGWITHGAEFDFSNIGKMKVHFGNEWIDYNWIICWILTVRIFFLSWYDIWHCSEAMNFFFFLWGSKWMGGNSRGLWGLRHVSWHARCCLLPLLLGIPLQGCSQPLSLSCHLPLHSRNEFLDTIPLTHIFKYAVVKIL